MEIHGRRRRLGAAEDGQHGAGRIHVVEGKLQGLVFGASLAHLFGGED